MTIQKRSVFVLGLWIPIPGLNPLNISMLDRRPRGMKSRTVCLSQNSKLRLWYLAAFWQSDTTVATRPGGIAHCIQSSRESAPNNEVSTESPIADESGVRGRVREYVDGLQLS